MTISEVLEAFRTNINDAYIAFDAEAAAVEIAGEVEADVYKLAYDAGKTLEETVEMARRGAGAVLAALSADGATAQEVQAVIQRVKDEASTI